MEQIPRSRTLLVLLVLVLVVFPAGHGELNQNDIRVVLDGRELTFDVPPMVREGRTLVPMRAISEALGALVGWDGATQTVTITREDTTVVLPVGSTTAQINGQPIALDVAATIIEGRTLVPLRFISKSLGADVTWSDPARTVHIQTSGPVLHFPDPALMPTPTPTPAPTSPPYPDELGTGEGIRLVQTNGPGGGVGYGLAIHPQNPDIIYVAGFKSTDGGLHWSRTNMPGGQSILGIRAMAIDPKHPNTVYAANINTGSVYKTTTGGQSWTSILVTLQPYALAIDPRDTQIVYVGTAEGQLHKSEDGGETWTDMLASSALDIIVSEIEINPVNPDEIYLGTGSWYNNSELDRRFNCPANKGIYRSRDGGRTWEHLENQMRDALVSDIDIAPTDTNVMYAVAADQHYNCTGTFDNQDVSIFKSVDGGGSWSKVLSDAGNEGLFNAMNQVAIDPMNENVVYTVASERVLKSLDGGETWATVTQPYIEPVRYEHAIEVAPSSPNIVALTGYYRTFVKSEDGGMTWRTLVEELTISTVGSVAVDPGNSARVIAGNIDGTVHITRDWGLHWERRFFGLRTQYPYGIAFHPNDPDVIFLGVSCGSDDGGFVGCGREPFDSGVWVTEDGGETWDKRYTGLKGDQESFEPECEAGGRDCALQVYDLLIDSTDPDVIYAGTSANGVFKSEDGGRTWREINAGIPKELPYVRKDISLKEQEECKSLGYPSPSSGFDCARFASLTTMKLAINPANAQEVWYTSLAGVYKSENGGESWSWVSDVFREYHAHYIAFDPHDPKITYVGTHRSGVTRDGETVDSNHGLYITRDGGVTWRQVGSDGPGEGHNIRSIAVDESNPDNVFVGTLEGRFFVSSNKGDTWTEIDFSAVGGLPAIDALQATSDGVIYAGTRGAGVWRGRIPTHSDGNDHTH
ncbi:MAG: hypothetical protein HYY09_02605 [Firmicutes bacterium]|nr:hypothetical protein [Bacillota bacterium]